MTKPTLEDFIEKVNGAVRGEPVSEIERYRIVRKAGRRVAKKRADKYVQTRRKWEDRKGSLV